MTDDTIHGDDEERGADDAFADAEGAEADEAAAAAEEEFFEEAGELLADDEEAVLAQREEAMALAQAGNLRAQADWFLVHKELLLLLFANCLFFAGVLAAWDRTLDWDTAPRLAFTGMSTIRGGLIFALSIHGFWTILLNFRYRQTIVWPFLINAIFALWVGIPGFTSNFGSDRWTAANDYMDHQTASFLAKLMAPLSNTAPGFWLLTAGGALVLIVLLRGVISGASSTKAKAVAAGGRRRRG